MLMQIRLISACQIKMKEQAQMLGEGKGIGVCDEVSGEA